MRDAVEGEVQNHGIVSTNIVASDEEGSNVRAVGALALVAIAVVPACAEDQVFTAAYSGTGRACSGGLYIRTKTIEWNSSFSVCKPSRYEVLEKDFSSNRRRIVYRLKTRSKHCRYEVVELEHAGGYGWSVTGYPSLEAYMNREAPDWTNSPLPERLVLSCPMVERD